MDSFFRVLTPFFGAPKNYQEMLWTIAVADFWLALICTFLLRYDPWIDGVFKRLEELPGLKEFAALAKLPQITSVDLATVSVVNVVIALAVMLFSRTTRFHDLISDLFGIRARFDHANILLPLALTSGAKMNARQVANIKRDRSHLMRDTFYKYASSTKENALVDKHDIDSALEAWTLYWVALEGLVIFATCALVSAIAASTWLLILFWSVSMAFLLFMHFRYAKLERRVEPEVQQIAGNAEANDANRQVFEAN
ncbi:hypothetical protein HAP48_0049440 (plasmid) [Bradyrhizobium septentrionale]|uniref:Uncharacterized protein n=1 Tax=Bradyrhizobium septentrionale TaxID=1404411 RepID=A0A973WAU9_9BRAD|nr:hypothetical protein [Bradyrhizobium septentrionale]UGY20983.1 hypothetical protein HAP48_0049440 [Bradyrhizobium septentrionale]